MTEGVKSRGGKRWIRMLLVFIIIGAGALVGFGYLWLDHRGIDLRRSAIELFYPQAIGDSFSLWREEQIIGNQGNILEVATATEVEKLSRISHVEIFGKSLVSKNLNIHVPATFRFYIDLLGTWKIEQDQHRLIVTAPPPRPSLPVAFDTRQLKKSVDGWGKYVPTNDMSELEKSISGELAKRAEDPQLLMKVKEESRRSIALFLETWLLTENRWSEGQFEELVILFEGENANAIKPALLLETVSF